MKINSGKLAALLVLGIAALVSCEPEEKTPVIEPVFPTEIYENYEVAAGSVESFTITPNMDWEVSVPTKDIQWFWLAKENDDQKYNKLSGEASQAPIKILVGVNETEEFSENRSVEVTLTMDGQSKVVAKFMRPAKARVLKVFAAEVDEWGFVPSENPDFAFTYSSEAVSRLSLIWPEEKSGFMVPFKIEANFDWEMTYPEWVKYIAPGNNYGKAGVVEMRFDGIPSKYPVAGAADKVIIKAADDASYTQEIELVIPGCGDRIDFGLWSSVTDPLTFNAAGQYNSAFMGYTDGPAGAHMTATRNARVIAVEWNSQWEAYDTKEASWVNISLSAWNEAAGADVIQDRDVEISVAANESETERKAAVFFLPESVTVDIISLFNEQGTEIKDAYKSYAIELIQEGKVVSGSYITMKSSPEALAEVGAAFEVSAESWLPSMFDAPAESSYKLTYSLAWSRDEAFMNFASPYTSYEIYDADGNRVSAAKLDSFWLSVMEIGETRTSAVIDMNTSANMEGFVKFIGENGETLAVVWCVFDPNFSTPGSGGGDSSCSVKFIGESAAYASMVGAYLEEITSGDLYDTYAEYNCPIYSLSYTSYLAKTMPMSISTPAYSLTTVNPYNMSDYFWSEGADGGATIYMHLPDDVKSATATMLFYGPDYSVVLVLVCNWAPVQ